MPAAQTQLKPRPTALAPEACGIGPRPRPREAAGTDTESFDQHLQKAGHTGQKPAPHREQAQGALPVPAQGRTAEPKAQPEAPGTPVALVLPAPELEEPGGDTATPIDAATDNTVLHAPDTTMPPSGEVTPTAPTEPAALPQTIVQAPLALAVPQAPRTEQASPASGGAETPPALPPVETGHNRPGPAAMQSIIGISAQGQTSPPAGAGAPSTAENPPGEATSGTTSSSGDDRPAANAPAPPARALAFASLLTAQDAAPAVTGHSPPPPAPPALDTTAPLSATTAQPQARAIPPGAVPMTIAALTRDGARQFEIRLDPAELGRIDVSIAVDREGAVRTHLVVERPETLHLLRNDAPKLEQAMTDAGLKPDSAGLSLSLRQGSGQTNGQDSGQQHPQRGGRSTDQPPATAPAAQDAARPYRIGSAASRLDLVL